MVMMARIDSRLPIAIFGLSRLIYHHTALSTLCKYLSRYPLQLCARLLPGQKKTPPLASRAMSYGLATARRVIEPQCRQLPPNPRGPVDHGLFATSSRHRWSLAAQELNPELSRLSENQSLFH